MNGKNKKAPLTLSRETLKQISVSTSIRTGVVVGTTGTASMWCPKTFAHCPPPKTSGCPM